MVQGHQSWSAQAGDLWDNCAGPPVYTLPVDEFPPGTSSGDRDQYTNIMSVPQLTSKDIVIGVMGITGVGKSTLISQLSSTAKLGEGLESCTIDVGIHEARVGGQRCFLIDTPGFDDTHRSNTDVLREIADWLNRSYQAKIQLGGIVYLHRIVDTRVSGSSLKNLRMFRKLCGPKGLSSVVLATTMWTMVTPEEGERRERELMTNKEFWGEMVTQGSVVMRQDQGEASAIKIIQHILGQRRRMVLDIQEEMANGKSLDERGAGRELEAGLERLKRQHDDEMRELHETVKETQQAGDKRAQAEISVIRADFQRRWGRRRKIENVCELQWRSCRKREMRSFDKSVKETMNESLRIRRT